MKCKCGQEIVELPDRWRAKKWWHDNNGKPARYCIVTGCREPVPEKEVKQQREKNK